MDKPGGVNFEKSCSIVGVTFGEGEGGGRPRSQLVRAILCYFCANNGRQWPTPVVNHCTNSFYV